MKRLISVQNIKKQTRLKLYEGFIKKLLQILNTIQIIECYL